MSTDIHTVEPIFARLFTVRKVGDQHVSTLLELLSALFEDVGKHFEIVYEGSNSI